MSERWIGISGFEGLYEVSDYGNVRSVDRYIFNKANGVTHRTKGVVLKGKITKYGYKELCLSDSTGKKHYFLVHRLVAMSFLPNPDRKKQVNHINSVKTDNRIENLEWCTPKENINHAMKAGLMKKGSQSTTSKLVEEQVVEIRNLFKDKHYSFAELGRKFNVDASLIGRIIKGKVWKHVETVQYEFDIDEVKGQKKKYRLKLTDLQIKEAADMVESGISRRKVAEHFGVTHTTISRLIKRGV